MQTALTLGLAIYIAAYAFEGVVRYLLNMAGADTLIFVRDLCLVLPIALIFAQQFFQRRLHPAYFVYLFVIGFHGLVMKANIGSSEAAVYGAKMLLGVLAGAILMDRLLQPGRKLLAFFTVIWFASVIGIVLDKYFVEFPWAGLTTFIGDLKVDISRDWDMSGDAKRAAGFMRSSIHAALFLPLLTFLLVYHLRRNWLRLVIAVATMPVLVMTTQKSSIIGYGATLALMALFYKRPVPALRFGLYFFMLCAVILPIAMPGYHMPTAEGQFSIMSFNLRVEDMWPKAWRWIDRWEAFPFGVGLGGIGGAQQFYAIESMNAADNLFIFLYAQFGLMCVLYLGWVAYAAMRVPGRPTDNRNAQAMASLCYLFCYGIFLSMLEDQMVTLFSGATLAWIGSKVRRQKQTDKPQHWPRPTDSAQLPAPR